MKNYYVLKKIKKKDLPNKDMFATFNDYYGTCQMQEIQDNGDIYICTDGSEIDYEQITIDLGE